MTPEVKPETTAVVPKWGTGIDAGREVEIDTGEVVERVAGLYAGRDAH